MIVRTTGKRPLLITLLILLIAIPAVSHAACEATLEWESDGSIAEGYYVFGREEGQDYDYDTPWWMGDNTFDGCTIDELEEDKTYYFVVRAYAGDQMSADSNEVRFSFENLPSEDLPATDAAPPADTSDSLSNNAVADGAGSTYRGVSGSCFIGSLFEF